jgi:predicted Fe-S protein YdhL (DUF1289 family)
VGESLRGLGRETLTPCNGTCKLEDGVCKGCGRDKYLIGAWSAMQDKEKCLWMAMQKYACRRCGGEYRDGHNFCARCGGVMNWVGEK